MKMLSMVIVALLFVQSVCYASIGFPFPGPGVWRTATQLSDTFTGTNGTLLSDHTSDSGHTWTRFTGTTGPFQLIDGYLVAGSVSTTAVYYSSFAPPSANYSVTGVLKVQANTLTAANMSIGGRFQSATGYGYFARISPSVNKIQLYRIGSTVTLLGEYSLTVSIGTEYTLTLVMNGSSISVKLNGSQVIEPVTDSTYTSGGVFIRSFATTTGTDVSLSSISTEAL